MGSSDSRKGVGRVIRQEGLPDDAKLLEEVLRNALAKSPKECRRLIGTGIIEEDYFEPLD